jgi:hypothetical protein
MNVSGVKGYVYTETIGDGENGESIIITPVSNASGKATCTIVSTGNTGKVQTSTSSIAAVNAGTATWSDWAKGNVTATTTDVLTGPVTAVRGVSVSGEIDFEMVI